MEKMNEQEDIFAPIGENDITRVIVCEFLARFTEYVERNCMISGAGANGLM
jgi:ribulose 1,5-bisphosphate synthetase/thiazole synthase